MYIHGPVSHRRRRAEATEALPQNQHLATEARTEAPPRRPEYLGNLAATSPEYLGYKYCLRYLGYPCRQIFEIEPKNL
jgi:hypothetical protein